jgi:serine/threonine protein kinase
MAEVYLGEDLVLHRVVALKVLAAELSRDEGFVERFRREAQAAAGLSHPNIVAVYDWGEANGSYFIVMEYVGGQTLAQLIRAEGPLSPERTAAVGADIAGALAAAHHQGVVHRDIKPANVLIGSAGQVKVTDFGIARAARWGGDAQLTHTGLVLGTAAYLSPEQAEGRAADERSDVYALGVVLYEMATRRPPFRGDSPVSIAYQHAREHPELPSRVNPQTPAWLEAVILKALAKDPDQRHASAEDLRSELSRSARQQTLSAATPPRPTRTAGAAAIAIVAAMVIAGAIYFGAFGPSGSHTAGHGTPATGTHSTTTRPPPGSTTSTTTSPPATTRPPTSFAGYQIVVGTGTSALYCPIGVALGSSGPTGPVGGGPPPGTPGKGGQGGAAGCGSNGGPGGHGGGGAPGAAGGTGGAGGNGGCPPATLTEMRAGHYPCNGTGSNGGGGGNGGNAAPGNDGGAGGRGGPGGDAENAKGGNGGNGGNATPTGPGGPGGPGQAGGGPTGTEPGVNGQNGANGSNG